MKRLITKIKQDGIRIRTLHIVMAALAVLFSLLLMGTIQKTRNLVAEAGLLEGRYAMEVAALLMRQRLLTGFLLIVTLITIFSAAQLILLPLAEFIGRIRRKQTLPMQGAYELRYLSKAYNKMYEENQLHNDDLQYAVEHDALTGLYNRGAFDRLREELKDEDIALLLIDVDKFKQVNDTYGHEAGDKVLKNVASRLSRSFRTTDYVCRTGGDEFAVIMTDMTPELRDVVVSKIENLDLAHTARRHIDDDVPIPTLSIGVAFQAQQTGPEDDLFKMADAALYQVKEHGRNGYAFFGQPGP